MKDINTEYSWKDRFAADLPLLGHRNLIAVTDMAYPLQTQAGIKTIDTNAPYMDVLTFVYREIEKAPHIKAVIYQDKELQYMDESMAAGIDSFRRQMKNLLGDRIKSMWHDQLIARIDEESRKFNVLILKTTQTIAYTSAFFELDCNYWDSDKENALRMRCNTP